MFERKQAVLLHAMGTEVQRLFYSLPDTGNTYTTAVAALKRYFVPAVNVVAERHKFRQRTPRTEETINGSCPLHLILETWEKNAT